MPQQTDHLMQLADFRALVLRRGHELYRDLAWRQTRDPYAIWISEVMLQQTQVSRVDGRWQRWMARFPNVEALASAELAEVLAEWQGLGYNRRAVAVHHAAQTLASLGGSFPTEIDQLTILPSIGPATAAGIRVFAYNMPALYLETNVRTVFLYELFPDAEDVPDSVLRPLIEASCPPNASNPADDPRSWYYALLDYGAWLKQNVPNPSRRSRSYVRQSRYEGSHRQKRAAVLRALLDARELGEGVSAEGLAQSLSRMEEQAGREPIEVDQARALLEELAAEGFCHPEAEVWKA